MISGSNMAYAQCANPVGAAGDQIYNTDFSVMQYCDGTDWTAMRGATPDSLDWDDFTDTMTLDVTTTIDMDTNAADLVFDGTTFAIDSSANAVGIGTTSPVFELHVHDSGSGPGTESSLLLTTGDTGTTAGDGFQFGYSNIAGTQFGTIWLHENTFMQFGTNNTERMRIDAVGGVGVGTLAANHASAILQADSTSKGFLAPRVSDPTSAIATPATGLIAYNTVTNLYEFYDGTAWRTIGYGSTPALAINDLTDATTDYVTDFNLFMGQGAGASIAAGGQYNIAIGQNAGTAITDGDSNIAIGYQSLSSNTTGFSNTAVGHQTLQNNTSNHNTAVGNVALKANTTGNYNAALGAQALQNNQTGSSNTALGALTLRFNTTAGGNTAIGRAALYENIDGLSNTAVGAYALTSNVTKTNNVAIGHSAMRFMGDNTATFSTANTAVGAGALRGGDTATPSNNTGVWNTALGYSAGKDITTGNNNLFLGFLAGDIVSTGSNNVFMGYQAGNLTTTGSDNIIIGSNTDASSATASNELNIGNIIFSDLSTDRVGIGMINTTAIDADALLELDATDKGFLAPRISNPTAAIGATTTGMLAFDTVTNKFQFYDGGSWQDVGTGAAPSIPADSLDWDDFTDTMTLDATTTIDMDTNSADLNFDNATLFIDSSSDSVGINTSSPAGDFHIDEPGGNFTTFRLTNSPSGATGTDGFVMALNTADAGLLLHENWPMTFGTNTTERMRIEADGDIGIGTTTPDASALLELASTSKGFIAPRVSDPTSAIAAPATGLIAYNTVTDLYQFYDGTSWVNFNAGGVGLFTDNTTHITRENFHIIDTGQTSTTAGLDGDGTRSFYDPNKGALRGGTINGGDAAWQNANIGTDSFAWGINTEASGGLSHASGANSLAGGVLSFAHGGTALATGYNSIAFGGEVLAGDGTAQTGHATAGKGNFSVAFGLGLASAGNNPRVSGNQSFGIFFGDQVNEDITATNVLALEGGSLLLSNDSGTACVAAKQGALRLNATADGLEMCDGAGTWAAFSATVADINDIGNVDTSGVVSGNILQYNGTDWVDATVPSNPQYSMVSGWPDAIVCTNGATVRVLDLEQSTSGGGASYHSTTTGNSFNYIDYDNSGNYVGQNGFAAFDCVTSTLSIASLYSAGKAFNFIGGATVADDTLDWDKFVDTMTLDATTTIDMDTNTADLNFDANTFVIDSSANSIGIGTAAPLTKLHVQQTDNTIGAGNFSPDASLLIEHANAAIELSSNAVGTTGSMIHLSEMDAGALVDRWTIVRETTNGTGNGDIQYRFGTNNAFGSNPVLFKMTSDGGFVAGSALADSAILQADSTSRGFLPPRVSNPTSAITAPATGLMAYNTVTNLYEFYNGTSWQSIGTGSTPIIAINDLTDATTDYATDFNMFMGDNAGASIAAGGQYNLAIGQNAGDAVTTGDRNVALGYNALSSSQTRSGNVAIGTNAARLYNNTTGGIGIVAIGDGAFEDATDTFSSAVVAIGSNALNTSSDTITATVAIGNGALENSGQGNSAEYNVAIGSTAGIYQRNGNDNVYIGHQAARGGGTFSHTGDNNIFIGSKAALDLDGDNNNNTIIGRGAAATLDAGDGNILLGYNTDVSGATVSNQLNIGNTIFGDLSTDRVGIGVTDATAIDTDAILELDSTTLGFLPPRVSNPAATIGATAAGLIAYDTVTNLYQFYDGTSWVNFNAGGAGLWTDLTGGRIHYGTTAANQVGVGTNNPGYTLDVNGDINMVGTGTFRVAGEQFVQYFPSTDDSYNSPSIAIGTGSAHTNLGAGAGFSQYSSALYIGTDAGSNVNTTGGQDLQHAIVGNFAGASITTGSRITALGYNAASGVTTAGNIVALGDNAAQNIDGFSIAIGSWAGGNSTGQSEVFIGNAAGANLTGDSNVAIGDSAGEGIGAGSSASDNVFIGYYSGNAITTGDNNIFVGSQSGDVVTTGSNNIIIGDNIDPSGATVSNQLNIGGTIFGDLSTDRVGIGVTNATGIDADALLQLDATDKGFLAPRVSNPTATIGATATGLLAYDTSTSTYQYYDGTGWKSFATTSGGVSDADNDTKVQVEESADEDIIRFDTAGTERMVINASGFVGIANSSPSVELDVTGDIEYTGTITDVSDIRLKTDIHSLSTDEMVNKIAQIETYSFKMKDDEKGRVEMGVMAQDLEKIFPELVKTANDEMGTKSVNYMGLIAPMIEATKALKAQNDTLSVQMASLQSDRAQTQASLESLNKQVTLLNKAYLQNNMKEASFASPHLWMVLLFGFMGGGFFVWILGYRRFRQS